MRLIDLSHPIHDSMPIYPSDVPVSLTQEKYYDKDHYNNFRLTTGMHSGTHVDSPMHLSDVNRYINNYPLDLFIGNGCLFDVRNEKCIEYKSDYADKIKDRDIVLFLTGNGSKFNDKTYFYDYPVIEDKLVDFLIGKRIKMLGIDSPSPDKPPFNVHKKLFNSGVVILENLVNLEQLLFIDKFEIIAFPLKIKADSSLVRAVAKIDN